MLSFTERINRAPSKPEKMAVIEEAQQLAQKYSMEHPQSLILSQVSDAERMYKTKAALKSPNTGRAHEQYLLALLHFADSLVPAELA